MGLGRECWDCVGEEELRSYRRAVGLWEAWEGMAWNFRVQSKLGWRRAGRPGGFCAHVGRVADHSVGPAREGVARAYFCAKNRGKKEKKEEEKGEEKGKKKKKIENISKK